MKKTKQAQQTEFPIQLLRSWEDSDCVNFAIALARITGWLLHVDWLSFNNGEDSIKEMKSLRVYVGDDRDNIFDLRGKQKITSFSNNIIKPIAKERGKGKGGVLTRYYSESKLFELPLRIQPDLTKVYLAEEAIRNNYAFLEKIPIRQNPSIPAHLAAHYTFSRCAVYASAMHNLTNLPAIAIIAKRYSDLFGHSKTGYVHSIILHPDGSAEDAWGIQSLATILARYGIVQYTLSEEEHLKVDETLKRNSKDIYEMDYQQAETLIKKYVLHSD